MNCILVVDLRHTWRVKKNVSFSLLPLGCVKMRIKICFLPFFKAEFEMKNKIITAYLFLIEEVKAEERHILMFMAFLWLISQYLFIIYEFLFLYMKIINSLFIRYIYIEGIVESNFLRFFIPLRIAIHYNHEWVKANSWKSVDKFSILLWYDRVKWWTPETLIISKSRVPNEFGDELNEKVMFWEYFE